MKLRYFLRCLFDENSSNLKNLALDPQAVSIEGKKLDGAVKLEFTYDENEQVSGNNVKATGKKIATYFTAALAGMEKNKAPP